MHVLVCTHTINSSAYSNSMGTLFYLTTAASHYPMVHTTYKTSLMDGTNNIIFFNSSVSHRITRISWNPVCYHDHLSLSSARLIQSKPFQTIYHPTIHLCMPRSSKWSLSLRLSYQNPECTNLLPHTCHMPHPSHPF